MSNAVKDSAWPVLVFIEKKPLSVALMNRKAYRKSLEAGNPWIVHPDTGRVLPWPGEPQVLSLREVSGGFELRLPGGSEQLPYGNSVPPEFDPDDRSAMYMEELPVSKKPDSIMDNLSALITQRHQSMPEGSYTTHLFEQGLDKILKKTGEEAVELLLARTEKDVIYESADLIYHLLVLLEASGLHWSDITGELARRHTE